MTKDVAENMDVVQNKIDNVDRDVRTITSSTKTYAESLKTKKVLLIKSTQDENKAADKKKQIMSKITAQVEEVKETNDGHLFVRFADRSNLEKAKQELEADEENEISVNEKGKLKPKIKVVNVQKDEEDIIHSIKMKNPWIGNLIKSSDDFEIIREIKAKNPNYKHYIIKCSPLIRRNIFDRDDKLFTLYSRCRVYDSYMPYQCYKCQNFGHSATNCRNNQICPICSGNHKANECTSNELKCNNCAKRGHSDTKHKSYDSNKCSAYKEEMSRMKNNTNHGFDE